MAYQLKVARFPVYRDMAGFDFTRSEVNEALVRQLHRCEFMEQANNVVLVGGPGTGKTHLATALGAQSIEHHHRRVRFFSTVELVNALEVEKATGKAGQIAHRLAYADMVIRDELGYLPFSASGSRSQSWMAPSTSTSHSAGNQAQPRNREGIGLRFWHHLRRRKMGDRCRSRSAEAVGAVDEPP